MTKERFLYSDWNMAGFSWSGTFYRDDDGIYHVTEHDPDFEETGNAEYTYHDLSSEDMLDYALTHEDENGDYGWGDDLNTEELLNVIFILGIKKGDLFHEPRSLSYEVLKMAQETKDTVLLERARLYFIGTPLPEKKRETIKTPAENQIIEQNRERIKKYLSSNYPEKSNNVFVTQQFNPGEKTIEVTDSEVIITTRVSRGGNSFPISLDNSKISIS